MPRTALGVFTLAAALLLVQREAAAQTCPTHTIVVNGVSREVPGASVDEPVTDDYVYGRFNTWNVADSVRFSLTDAWGGGTGAAVARGSYVVLGVPAGSSVPLRVVWSASLRVSYNPGYTYDEMYPFCGQSVSTQLKVGNIIFPQRSAQSHLTSDQHACDPGVGGAYEDYLYAATTGTPFVVEVTAAGSVSGEPFTFSTTSSVTSSLSFGGLPPGAFIAPCGGSASPVVLAVGPGAHAGLALAPAGSNPAHGAIRVTCVIPRGGPVVLRLFDAGGRVMESRVLDASDDRRTTLTLGESLAPGAYYVRLSQGASHAVQAVNVIR